MKKIEVQAKCKPGTSGRTKHGREKNSNPKKFHNKSSSGSKTLNNNNKQQLSKQKTSRKDQTLISKKRFIFDPHKILAKEPQNLVTYLEENLADFTEFLATSLPPNTVVQTVFIMEKLCLMQTNEQKFNAILSQIQENWMKQLDMYLVKLSLEEEGEDKTNNEAFWKNPEAFWNSLVGVFETIVEKFQNNLTSKVVKSCLITIGFHQNSHITCANEIIIEKLRKLNEKLSKEGELNEGTDYKTITVYPKPDEVLIDKRAYIRENIIDGSYGTVEHYLDTHFRLLREDFLGPLRKAICIYRESLKDNTKEKITEFHVYTNARFIRNSANYHQVCTAYNMGTASKSIREQTYKILNPGNCNHKYVFNSKDFMIANLLCFSADNFKTVFFGVVAADCSKNNKSITVELFENRPFLYDQSYTMLASTNYFSPYYLVLKALQNFSTNNFPMEKYIINVMNEQEPPGYLTPSTSFTINDSTFTVLNFESWPSKEELNLNEMQYEAFRHALTSRFAIVQGPPGTGKTHLGLKIAQTLIQNRQTSGTASSGDNKIGLASIFRAIHRQRTRTVHSEPILVIAYTNHALDQFLEGLVPYTKDIIRMGHQTKSDTIRQFNFKPNYRIFGCEKEKQINIYNQIQTLLADNQSIMDELESVLSYKGIFNVKKIALVIPELCSSPLCYFNPEKIQSWLLGKFDTVEERNNRWNMMKEICKGFKNPTANLQFRFHVSDHKNYILTMADLQTYAKKFDEQLANKNAVNLDTIFQEWAVVEEDYKQIKNNVLYLQWRLEHAEEHHNLYTPRPTNEDDLNQLSYNDRWILYFHWLDCYVQHLKNAVDTNTFKIQQLSEEAKKCKQQANSLQVSQAAVVGMTTSGAALNQHLLENLKCRIVIIEEAAEVLESHIVTSLTSHCQHLVLIGDHQQLRPSTADYEIEKDYDLGISMFERLVRNGVCYKTLGVQHRMRPEIARLIVPAIYPKLENHPSTCDFPNIKGIRHNVYFITHTHPEVSLGNSKKNVFEANYVVALARHLILQDIDPSKITILTTYKGQMYEIKEQQKKSKFAPLHQVHVTVVDNFQGEENQIILLSLVRSNNYYNIGFLAIENRVCVALSRAKRGFYMIGNMNVLSRSSKIWPKINEVLENNQQIGPGLQLACQLHPLNVTTITKPEDFLQVPEGGCYEPCNAELECGHACQKKCHVVDPDHIHYRCMQPCLKIICDDNHPCPMKCCQTCDPCSFPVVKTLPCEHVTVLPCYMEVADYKCEMLVSLVLKCGHSVDKLCFEDTENIKCIVKVETVLPKCGHKVRKHCYVDKEIFPCKVAVKTIIPECGHDVLKPCYQSIDKISCKVRIKMKPKCGHTIVGQCGLKNSVFLKCPARCLKKLKCGHICQNICHYAQDKLYSIKEHQCQAPCKKFNRGCKAAHKCNLLCYQPCEPCHENLSKILPCGHPKMVTCSTFNKRYICESRCKGIKPCGHVCYSKCHPICDYSACTYKVFKHFPGCDHGMKVNCSSGLDGKICWKCSPRRFKDIKREE